MWILPKNYQLSSHFAQDMVASKEDLTLPGLNIESSLLAKSKPTRLQTWQTRWKHSSFYPHLFGRILKPCQWSLFETKLTSSLAAIHVSPLVQQDSEKEQTTLDTCGLTLGDTSNQLDLFSASLKTSKDISALDSEKSLATWKALVTEQRGEYSQRVKLAHLTRESESTSWATPNTMDHLPQRSEEALVRQATTQRKGRTKPANLREQVNPTAVAIYQEPTSWPTATVFDVTGGSYPTELVNGQWRSKHSKDPNSPWYGAKLRDAVETAEKMWPTAEKFPTPGTTECRSDTLNLVNRVMKGKQIMLTHHVRLYPTPSARDWKDTPGMAKTATNPDGSERKRNDQLARAVYATENPITGHLNPEWVEWLMGVPTGWTELGCWETE